VSNDRVRIGRLSFKGRGDTKARSILTVWRGSNGGYSITKDKHTEQYPAIGLFEALKAWGQGEGYLDWWPAERQAQPREQARPQTVNGPRVDRDFAAEDEWRDEAPPF
jgi:hypothetical protein